MIGLVAADGEDILRQWVTCDDPSRNTQLQCYDLLDADDSIDRRRSRQRLKPPLVGTIGHTLKHNLHTEAGVESYESAAWSDSI